MTRQAPEEIQDTVRRLREAFDEVFAAPRLDTTVDVEDVLVVEVGGHVFGLRTVEIAGIAARPRVVELPGAPACVLGLMALRGAVLPVCSLGALLGVEGRWSDGWVAWIDGPRPAAFAFDTLLGLAQVPAGDRVAGNVGPVCTRGAARIDGVVRPLIDMEAVAAMWTRGPPPSLEI